MKFKVIKDIYILDLDILELYEYKSVENLLLDNDYEPLCKMGIVLKLAGINSILEFDDFGYILPITANYSSEKSRFSIVGLRDYLEVINE